MAYGLAILASATALALTPSAATARATYQVWGITYGDCYDADGWYEWTADGSAGGYPKYDTDGVITVAPWANCDSWIDSAVLLYSGKKWQNGSWTTIGWKKPPSYGDEFETDYELKFNDVRDIRFKVCNVHDGITDGCDSVS
ncbi:hypothetical protein AB0I98_07765 [Streptomyces sp. NPDC050211]|uniref:hypothetical protein n=1 Tax=Streptomyces sp. NPDC050211 TaxID=3154932 RepID=UPI00343BC9A0